MDTAKEDEDVRAALVSVIEAEERVKLIKAALKAKVGFSEIEYFNLCLSTRWTEIDGVKPMIYKKLALRNAAVTCSIYILYI